MIVVLMGVSGSGKTTIGNALAERTGAILADADDYHPLANKQKMAAGPPLDDAVRQPCLETLNRVLRGWFAAGQSGVLACSAFKEIYGQHFRQACRPEPYICTFGRIARDESRSGWDSGSMST